MVGREGEGEEREGGEVGGKEGEEWRSQGWGRKNDIHVFCITRVAY